MAKSEASPPLVGVPAKRAVGPGQQVQKRIFGMRQTTYRSQNGLSLPQPGVAILDTIARIGS